MVGGVSALIGAKMLGPRIGKYLIHVNTIHTTVAIAGAIVVVTKMEPSSAMEVAAAPLKPYQPSDPVGAVAVHCLNGIWGTIAVGLFATDTAPAYARG